MAWQRIHNRTGVPINVKFTNAGIIYYHENDVKDYTEFFVGGVGWDFTVYYSSDATHIDPSKDNVAPISAIVTTVAGGAIAVVGAGLTIATFGAATPVAVAGAAIAAGGIAGLVGSVGVEIAGAVLYPATVTGLYGANDHNFYIDGGFEWVVDPNTKQLTITKVKPFAVSYINCQTNAKTEAPGYALPVGA